MAARCGLAWASCRSADGADQLRWFDLEPCYVFHGVNAFRAATTSSLDVCRLSSMFAPARTRGLGGERIAATLDDRTRPTGVVADDVLETDDPGDLPGRDPRRVGREHRYGYLAGTRETPTRSSSAA